MKDQIQLQIDKEVKEIVIREGTAPVLFSDTQVELCGNIFAPGEYVTKRIEEISQFKKKTHVVVDYDALSIELVVNEESHFAKVIIGKLEMFDGYMDFGINSSRFFSVQALYKMLRLKRAYFKDRDQHALILEQLKKFEAKTEIEFKNTNDFKGTTAFQKIQVCKTNLSYNFILNVPIYKGTSVVSFPVEIEFEPTDGTIVCWLVSEDAAELEIKIRDEIMKGELTKFADFVVIQK